MFVGQIELFGKHRGKAEKKGNGIVDKQHRETKNISLKLHMTKYPEEGCDVCAVLQYYLDYF